MILTADWLSDPLFQRLCTAIEVAGFEVYAVGGCVRNTILNLPVSDIDLATNAAPTKVTKLAKKAGFKAIPTGIEHGTITAVQDGKVFEITTYRCDMETDGRHATVRFSKSIHEDAQRRDFTMNAIYADRNGRVIDPNACLIDLKNRCVRFIGEPADRIAEDYLRILRFFRFNAQYGDPAQGIDADGLAACATNAENLNQLSAERVTSELRKLLGAADPSLAVAAMEHSGVLSQLAAGASSKWLPILASFEESFGIGPNWLRRCAVLGGDWISVLRLSRNELKRFKLTTDLARDPMAPSAMGYKFGAELATDVCLVHAALTEAPPAPDILAQIDTGTRAVFPISAADLMPKLQGKELGDALRSREDRWIASGFALSRGELLA
jgi:poly(A) polymerase